MGKTYGFIKMHTIRQRHFDLAVNLIIEINTVFMCLFANDFLKFSVDFINVGD